ncbi:unnamed protein product [Dibothriocephalus latus]|uniref:Uncharacterized protein n=1 Tax=Dibothriocephalus latus TaxID=60516 RepID=A0A3P7QVV6_DIBLA|nr:unnamed protein product [Dibothriocephalus latus]
MTTKVSSKYRAENFGLWCWKTSDSSHCRTALVISPEIGEFIGVSFHLLLHCSVKREVRPETELQELGDLGRSKVILLLMLFA